MNTANITFTSTLPLALMESLNQLAKKMKVPKNKIIEKALRIYLEQAKRAEYVKSYKIGGDDIDILKVAEEDMNAYYNQIKDE